MRARSSRLSAVALSLALACLALSCGSSGPTHERAPARAGVVEPARASKSSRAARGLDAAPGPGLGEVSARWEPATGEVVVSARWQAGAGAYFALDVGAEPFVKAAEASRDGATWTAVTRAERTFTAAPCADGACHLRYRYALREAARRLDDVDVASLEGQVVEAPPSTWVLAPFQAPRRARVRLRVTTPEGARFVTGLFRSTQPDVAGAAWDVTLDDLSTAPYSAFGPLRTRTVEAGDSVIELALAPGKLAVTDDALAAWVESSARALTSYLGRFPMPTALVLLVPGTGRWVGGGKTLSGGGGAVLLRIGEDAPLSAYATDWVLVHEMSHLVFPSVPKGQDWAEEGFATYVEPFARVRAGLLREEDAWLGLFDGLPNGLPRPGDRGLDRTPTWGRVYWGGALFYLLADVELRKTTNNRFGLEHAMRGVLDAGGNHASRWPLADVLATADRAVGSNVLGDLYAKMATSPHPVDLDALFASLGVRVSRGGVRLDDGAPLAAVRRAIARGR